MNTTRWSSSCGVFEHLRLLEDMVAKAAHFLNRKPRLSQSKLLQEPPIRGSYRATRGAKKVIQIFIPLNLYSALMGKHKERFLMKKASALPTVSETEEWRLGDKCQWWLESWARKDKSLMTTAVYEERGGQVKTLVKEYLTVRFS